MFKIVRFGLFVASAAGTLLTMLSQWDMHEKVVDAYGYTDERANAILIEYGNSVSAPMLMLSFACLIIGLLLPKLLPKT